VVTDGSCDRPKVGTRVVGVAWESSWAEQVATPCTWVAELPDNISFAHAAALPIVGLTALRALRIGGLLLGSRVLITAASGSVGRLAVQLAHLAGADVTAMVRSEARAHGLAEVGADTICADLDDLGGRFDLILELVGGESLARLATMVEPDGTLVMMANLSKRPTTFQDIRAVYVGSSVRLQSLSIRRTFAADPPSRDLGYLVKLIADGRLDLQVAREMPWEDMPTVLAHTGDRTVPGKLVLSIRLGP
jgi:NADPH2:quinone reductase